MTPALTPGFSRTPRCPGKGTPLAVSSVLRGYPQARADGAWGSGVGCSACPAWMEFPGHSLGGRGLQIRKVGQVSSPSAKGHVLARPGNKEAWPVRPVLRVAGSLQQVCSHLAGAAAGILERLISAARRKPRRLGLKQHTSFLKF